MMTKDISCSFCGMAQNEVKRMITGPSLHICNCCVERMGAQLNGRQADQEIRLRDEIGKTVVDRFSHIVTNLDFGALNDKYQRLVKVKFKGGPDSPTFPEVFDEFKRGVEQEIPSGDYKTRYDLGIAYSEMGLKEDALRELIQALRYALLDEDHERAADVMSALLIVQLDPALVIGELKRIFLETSK